MSDQSLNCASCSEPVLPIWKVCPSCGKPLEKATSPAMTQAGDGSVVSAQVNRATHVASQGRDPQHGINPAGQPMVSVGSESVAKVDIQNNFYGFSPVGLNRGFQQPIKASDRFRNRHNQDSAALMFEDGRRTLLLAKREVKLGRQKKTNDIVVRFLPPSERLNELSLRISQEHLRMALTEKGLSIKNQGRFGTAVNRSSAEIILLSVDDCAEDRVELRLGSDPIQVEEPFDLELHMFRWRHDLADQSPWGPWDRCFDAVGARPSTTYRIAQAAGVDAIRLQRKTNLREEEYVLLFGQALIGSLHRCTIDAEDPVNARILYMARCFWLENLGEESSVRVQGESLPPGELVPLSPGMALTFGQTSVRFDNFAQLHL